MNLKGAFDGQTLLLDSFKSQAPQMRCGLTWKAQKNRMAVFVLGLHSKYANPDSFDVDAAMRELGWVRAPEATKGEEQPDPSP